MFIKNYCKISSNFCGFVSTSKSSTGSREIFALLPFVPDEENSVLSGLSFSLFTVIHDCTEAKHNCKLLSAAAESLDAKSTYSRLSSAYR